MKIVDYSPLNHNLNTQSNNRLVSEVFMASLIFILPTIILFILSR